MQDLAKKTVSGAMLNIAVNVTRIGLQFFVVLPILARILPPSEFGVIAMAMAFVSFLTMFNDLGISAALVREPDPSPAMWATAFWVNLALGVSLAVLSFSTAGLVAGFFGEPMVEPLTQWLSIILIMACLFQTPMAWLQRNFKFRTIAVIDLTSMIVAAVLAIAMALSGAGVWALVGQQLALWSIKSVMSLFCHKAPLGFVFRWSEIQKILPYSLGLMGFTFTNFLSRHTDNILIGRFLGADALGYYGRAYQVMMMPIQSLAVASNYAMFPALSAVASDPAQLRSIYLRSLSLLSLVIFPLMIGIAIVAEPFVLLMFGANWVTMIPLLSLLCVVGLLQSLVATANTVWKAIGNSKVLFRWSMIQLTLFTIAFAIGVQRDILFVGQVYLAANIVLFIPYQWLTLRKLGANTADLAGELAPSVLSAAFMALVVLAVAAALKAAQIEASYLRLAILGSTGVLAYGTILWVAFNGFSRRTIADARDYLRR